MGRGWPPAWGCRGFNAPEGCPTQSPGSVGSGLCLHAQRSFCQALGLSDQKKGLPAAPPAWAAGSACVLHLEFCSEPPRGPRALPQAQPACLSALGLHWKCPKMDPSWHGQWPHRPGMCPVPQAECFLPSRGPCWPGTRQGDPKSPFSLVSHASNISTCLICGGPTLGSGDTARQDLPHPLEADCAGGRESWVDRCRAGVQAGTDVGGRQSGWGQSGRASWEGRTSRSSWARKEGLSRLGVGGTQGATVMS